MQFESATYILVLCIEEEAILTNIDIRGPVLARLLPDEMSITGNPVTMVEGSFLMNPIRAKVKSNEDVISHSRQAYAYFPKIGSYDSARSRRRPYRHDEGEDGGNGNDPISYGSQRKEVAQSLRAKGIVLTSYAYVIGGTEIKTF
jgi:hypothetical protein